MWLKVFIAFQSVEISPSAVCASALVQTSRVERWRCAPTSCRGSSQSGPSWNGMKVKISLGSRWSHYRLFKHFRTRLHNFTAAVTVCRLLNTLIKASILKSILPLQIEGCFPDTMTRCAELINNNTEVDFVDINSGCPIDLVFKKVKLWSAQRIEGSSSSAIKCKVTIFSGTSKLQSLN